LLAKIDQTSVISELKTELEVKQESLSQSEETIGLLR